MNLYRVIYSSYAKPDLDIQELKDIMEASTKNNKEDGITGLLCYGDSMFLQLLEGDQEKVSTTYHRIARDERHHGPLLIECQSISKRLFEVWSMQAIQLTDLNREQVNNIVLKYSGSALFRPNSMTPLQCVSFLKEMATLFQLSDSVILEL